MWGIIVTTLPKIMGTIKQSSKRWGGNFILKTGGTEKILDKSRVRLWTEFIFFRMWSSCGSL
jgi:hypothetical protein